MCSNRIPYQPVVIDHEGTVRFFRNRIVEMLLDEGPFDMNEIARLAEVEGRFTDEERAQFAQLIGYSIDGYRELSYVQRIERRQWRAAHGEKGGER